MCTNQKQCTFQLLSSVQAAVSDQALAANLILPPAWNGDSPLQVSMDLQSSTSERGTAAVIDGSRLLVTPLRRAAVPPPLSAVVLEAQAPVLCVTHRHGCASEVKTAMDSNSGLLQQCNWNVGQDKESTAGLLQERSHMWSAAPLRT